MASTLRSWLLAGITGAATAATSATFAYLAHSGWVDLARPATEAADILLTILATLGLVLTLWLGAATVLSALAQLPGAIGAACADIAARVAPAAVRKATAVVLGTTVAAAVAPGTAAAGPLLPARHTVAVSVVDPGAGAITVPDPGFHPPRAERSVPDPGFRPPAPAAPPVPATLGPLTTSGPRVPSSVEDQYVVRRGDTLWDVAARHLGPRGSAAAIAREWPRWYAANRAVIGPDPHHIEPGQRLRPPGSATEGEAR